MSGHTLIVLAPVLRFMRHDHIVVTLDPDSKARIRADLDAGESVEAWVADAVERKLDGDASESGRGGDGGGMDAGEDEGVEEDETDAETDEMDYEAERGGYEFVDDCAI